MQIQIGVSKLQGLLGVMVGGVIPKMGNCDFGLEVVYPVGAKKMLSRGWEFA